MGARFECSFDANELLTHTVTHQLTYPLIHAPTHSPTLALTRSRTHALTHSRAHSLTHSLAVPQHCGDPVGRFSGCEYSYDWGAVAPSLVRAGGKEGRKDGGGNEERWGCKTLCCRAANVVCARVRTWVFVFMSPRTGQGSGVHLQCNTTL